MKKGLHDDLWVQVGDDQAAVSDDAIRYVLAVGAAVRNGRFAVEKGIDYEVDSAAEWVHLDDVKLVRIGGDRPKSERPMPDYDEAIEYDVRVWLERCVETGDNPLIHVDEWGRVELTTVAARQPIWDYINGPSDVPAQE